MLSRIIRLLADNAADHSSQVALTKQGHVALGSCSIRLILPISQQDNFFLFQELKTRSGVADLTTQMTSDEVGEWVQAQSADFYSIRSVKKRWEKYVNLDGVYAEKSNN